MLPKKFVIARLPKMDGVKCSLMDGVHYGFERGQNPKVKFLNSQILLKNIKIQSIRGLNTKYLKIPSIQSKVIAISK